MRQIVPCFACSLCAVHTPIGFTGHASMLCTARNDEAVSNSDGCTLGEPGTPMAAVTKCVARIEVHETVYGWHDERG